MRATTRRVLVSVFGLLVLQGAVAVVVRVATGSGDRIHPLLHLVSGAVGLLLSRRDRLHWYALGFGTGYAALGAAGALGLVRLPWLPLGPADHGFHIALGLGVAMVARRTLLGWVNSGVRVSGAR